ncbi:DUF4350 domain-containing protein [Siansivirga zeaxanthinifaciens]|uniref:DUF4350 domain-containing protein n=1 Tax=Siansivirga zeaxanthinifaciens TaxID=762954 RepID=UPI0012B660CB|nr:DUF4350 domain-containing protein [Siansivirga zeaxanthinifaciens]
MMKKLLPILIIIALILFGAFFLDFGYTKKVDWEESFNEKSNKPFGLSIFYKELPNLFKNQKIRTVYYQPSSYFNANRENSYGDHVAKGTFISIGTSNYLTDFSINSLLKFAYKGNTVFISDYFINKKIQDTLKIAIKYIPNKDDNISYVSLQNSSFTPVKLDRSRGDYYFSEFDTTNYKVLGHSKIDYKHVNFIEVPFGKGRIFIHTEPKAFTNYHLLKENRYTYTEAVLSYLPNSDIYYDSYTKIQTPYNNEVEKKSNLSWFLDQLSFRWAWYTALIFTLLFIIFNAKRRQRIIKILKPLENTSVAFVKTISNLYIENQDYENLIHKKNYLFS